MYVNRWRTKLHGDLPSGGEREINLTAKRKAEGGEEAGSQSADLGPLKGRESTLKRRLRERRPCHQGLVPERWSVLVETPFTRARAKASIFRTRI